MANLSVIENVIMHQSRQVNQLDDGSGADEHRVDGFFPPAGEKDEGRAQALPAVRERVAHQGTRHGSKHFDLLV